MIMGALLAAACTGREKDPFLSNLHATADDPIYTTYAAAMERSQFVLDEGYQFSFYEPGKGIRFYTDTGGALGIAFKQDGSVVRKLSEMDREPVITASYPDMVTYHYYPFEDIRVEATFLVQSSRAALWDVRLTNESGMETGLEIYPYMRIRQGTFEQVSQSGDNRSFFFMHHEYPDGWTRNHDLPHVTEVYNVFSVSGLPDREGSFNSYSGEPFNPPSRVFLDREPQYQVNGRALSREGERYTGAPPAMRLQVYLNGDKGRLLTDESPIWGAAQGSINSEGFFRAELGNLGEVAPGDAYTFAFYHEQANAGSSYQDTVREARTQYRRDVTLETYEGPKVPGNLTLQEVQGDVKLSWTDVGNSRFHVYRRSYGTGDAVYTRVAGNLDKPSFRDSPPTGEGPFGYIVTAEDPSTGKMGMHSREVSTVEPSVFTRFMDGEEQEIAEKWAKVVSFEKKLTLAAGETGHFRVSRVVSDITSKEKAGPKSVRLLDESLDPYLAYNEELFSAVPEIKFDDPDRKMLYWSAWNMMRQVFYPPEGESSYNYYVFSREPTWGWGHGGQVFHESITMQAYAFLDPESAMNSQRVYSERQHENGYINYRTGSYLNESIRFEGELTSSAPWYNWINREVYDITGDSLFLHEMYTSGKRFYNFYTANRDKDGDGLAEWGGHAVLESVRDALVAVWDQVDWPSNFEGVDVNSMLIKEAKSLEYMALKLGLNKEARKWREDYTRRAELVNRVLWDEENGFYYNADKRDNDFTYKEKNDLKRDEIIGFLPMWAGIASREQAARLVEKLTDSTQFWRRYGVPSLSASDPYYNDKGYWNGPVWVEWDYMIMQGLLNYGYDDKARELVDRVSDSMIIQLKENHNLWEFYSPDEPWAGYHKTYIWAGIINRMMMDTRDK